MAEHYLPIPTKCWITKKEPWNKYLTACGKKVDTGSVSPIDYNGNHRISCKACLKSTIYKNDLYHVEVGLDGDVEKHTDLWFDTRDNFGSKEMRNAACVFLQNKEGKVLAVSRGDDLTNWGLPGGKCERGETTVDAAVRELKEETGLVVDPANLVILYTAKVESKFIEGRTFDVCTYAVLDNKYSGELTSSDEGTAMWVEPKQLVSATCTFADYNKKVLKIAGLLKC